MVRVCVCLCSSCVCVCLVARAACRYNGTRKLQAGVQRLMIIKQFKRLTTLKASACRSITVRAHGCKPKCTQPKNTAAH
jgi:hypothetical protein